MRKIVFIILLMIIISRSMAKAMRIICLPKDFEEITNDRYAYNGMVNPGEVNISLGIISLYEDDKGLCNLLIQFIDTQNYTL